MEYRPPIPPPFPLSSGPYLPEERGFSSSPSRFLGYNGKMELWLPGEQSDVEDAAGDECMKRLSNYVKLYSIITNPFF
jgi:hypothetical protein